MSHDESLHTYYSWKLAQGEGYRHDPMMHGPFQFHLLALTYTLFGDSDLTSRLPAAIFSIATVALVWKFRRYLGSVGTLLAALLMCFSPYMMYYGRYVRNEAFVALFGILLLYAVLRYLETGNLKYLILYTIATSLHFATKETSYIYSAQILIFLFFSLVIKILREKQFSINLIRKERSFDLFIVTGTFVLPLLAAFPLSWLGIDPRNYFSGGIWAIIVILLFLVAISIAIGFWWRKQTWLILALCFYLPFILLYSTFLTYPIGILSGFTGSLGYWITQQAVQRGSQPWYYYIFIQIPIYEFLPLIGSIAGIFVYLKKNREDSQNKLVDDKTDQPSVFVIPLFIYWSIASLLSFTIAGEKMPWLTVHIVLPMIILAGWAIGIIIHNTDWKTIFKQHGLYVILVTPVFLASLSGALIFFTRQPAPFSGTELPQLQATATFLTALLGAIASGTVLIILIRNWSANLLYRLFTVLMVFVLFTISMRSSIRATFINYDSAKEYLVYAHAARGVKDVMQHMDEISLRLTDGYNLQVARDSVANWPLVWYMRHYTAQVPFEANPTRLRELPVVIVGDGTSGSVQPFLEQTHNGFKLIFLWWPNMDYFNLSIERIVDAILDPNLRAGILNIWLNRDYSLYATATGSSTFLESNWNPNRWLELYIRKDMVSQLWNYGSKPAAPQIDPYEQGVQIILASFYFGSNGIEPGQFSSPHGIAIAPDGSLYIADSRNHRVQHFSSTGILIRTWGTPSNTIPGEQGPPGTFNEPWGIAVGPDGMVYVADTWNHRIQKFTADGIFVKSWGYFGQAETGDALWGPRGIFATQDGRILVTDTGNKRVVIFDTEGNFLTDFGRFANLNASLDEPVGIWEDLNGLIYVADTWNQQVKVFIPDENRREYSLLRAWDIFGWFSQNLENKPYITVSRSGNVFITDPEGYRILEFNSEGNFIRTWGTYSSEADGFGLPSGIASDPLTGLLWVSDAGNGRIFQFLIPGE